MGPLEKQLVLAVNKAKALSQSKTSFSLLLLSFGKLHEGFAKINGLMLSFHDKRASESEGHAPTTKLRGKVRCSELQSRISELRLNANNPTVAETLKALKGECSLGTSGRQEEPVVDLDSFILFWTVVHLKDSELVQFPEIRAALLVVESAFLSLDSSHDGMLERSELAEAMRPDSSVHGVKRSKGSHKHTGTAAALFRHFDLDKSGSISFKEFLLGLFTIVMDVEIEQDEEEEQRTSAAQVHPDIDSK